jgi:hypothetical protein
MNSLRTCAKRFEVSSCGTINPCGSIGFYSIPLNESTRFNLLECEFGITERLDVVLVSQLLINAVTGEVKSWYGTCPVIRHIRTSARMLSVLTG